MKIKIIIITIISSLFFLNNIYTQQDSLTLPSDELQIIKDFDAQLEEATKIDIYPSLPALDTLRKVQTYIVDPKLLDLTYEAPQIKPIPLLPKALPAYYNGFAKVGIGYPLSPLLEVGYQQFKNKLLIGGKGLYHAAFNDKQLDNQKFNNAKVNINGEYFFNQGFSLGTDLGYQYNNRFFYGYDHDLFTFESNEVQQHFSTIDANLFFKNSALNQGDIHYKIEGDIYNISDNYNAKENAFGGEIYLAKYFNKKHILDFKIKDTYTIFSNNNEYKANLFQFIPSFTYTHNIFKIKAGVNAALLEEGFNIFPDAEVLFNIYKNNVSFYLGWLGYAEQNSFRSLSEKNYFVISNPSLEQSKINYPHGGLIFDFSKIKVSIESGYKMIENQPFYINDWANDSKRFSVVYDNVNYLTTDILINTEIIEHLNLDFNFIYQQGQTDSLSARYHDDPNLNMNIKLAYSGLLNNKLTVGTSIFTGSKINYLSDTNTDETIAGFADLNLFTAYKINNKFNLFLNLNNITNQKYQRWNGYPNFGFNTMIGFLYKFK